MGDSGSMLLGLLLGSVSLVGTTRLLSITLLIVPIIVALIPIIDTAAAIVRRLRKHESIATPDAGHIQMCIRDSFMIWPRAQAAAERITAVLQCEPSVHDPDDAMRVEAPAPNRAHTVRFEDVRFTFEGAEEPTLDGISFELEAGKTYALIGATGSGKSVLCLLYTSRCV